MLCGSLEGQREPLDTRVPSSQFHGWLYCTEHSWGRALGAEGWAVAVLLSRRAAVGKSPSCRLRSAGAVSASVREQGPSSARGHPALPAPPAAAAGGFVWGHSRGVCAGQFAGGRAALAVSRPHEAPLELPVRVRGALRRCGLPHPRPAGARGVWLCWQPLAGGLERLPLLSVRPAVRRSVHCAFSRPFLRGLEWPLPPGGSGAAPGGAAVLYPGTEIQRSV